MEIIAQRRTKLGKKTKALRRERVIPGVVFGKELESIPISLHLHDFLNVYRQAGETNLVDLKVEDATHPVLIREVQIHPVSSAILHVNLQKVNLKEKIKSEIPVELVNADQNPFVKSGEALPLLLLDELMVEALPTDLPDRFEVDVSKIENIGDAVSINDLSYDHTKVEILGHTADELVVKLDYAVQAETEEETTEAEQLEKLEVLEEAPAGEAGEEGEDSQKDTEKE